MDSSDNVVPARAYGNQMFLRYVQGCGCESELVYAGRRCTYAPDGGELARAGHAEQLLTCRINSAGRTRSRAINTYMQHRRTDLYPAMLDVP
jgi:predicted amidohydrolase